MPLYCTYKQPDTKLCAWLRLQLCYCYLYRELVIFCFIVFGYHCVFCVDYTCSMFIHTHLLTHLIGCLRSLLAVIYRQSKKKKKKDMLHIIKIIYKCFISGEFTFRKNHQPLECSQQRRYFFSVELSKLRQIQSVLVKSTIYWPSRDFYYKMWLSKNSA